MSQETWKPIPGFARYEVSDRGNVRHIAWRRDGIARNLKPYFNKGYAFVSAKVDGKNKKLAIHRCVLLAFRGEPDDDDTQACHLDGDRAHNLLENLIWGTRKVNASHREWHGTDSRGERNGATKLRESDIHAIRERISAGDVLKDIAHDFGVSRPAISLIKSGETWASVSRRTMNQKDSQ